VKSKGLWIIIVVLVVAVGFLSFKLYSTQGQISQVRQEVLQDGAQRDAARDKADEDRRHREMRYRAEERKYKTGE